MDKKDWLREEIVKLEGMKIPIEITNGADIQGHNQALQTIIDRYYSELDQSNN